MAISKEGTESKVTAKGEKSFSSGYIAPTMEVINKKHYYFGGIENITPEKYKWAEYKKQEKEVERDGRTMTAVAAGEVEDRSQNMEGGFFLHRDSRTDKAYIMTSEGTVKKI